MGLGLGLGLGTGRHGMGHITDECNPSVCAGIVDLVRVRGGVGVEVGVGVRVSGCSGIVDLQVHPGGTPADLFS